MPLNWASAKTLVLIAGGVVLGGLVGYTASGLILSENTPALVADEAALMTEEQRAFLAEYHGFLVDDHDIDYRVVTARETGDINRFAVDRFSQLFSRSRSTTGRGLLLVVDPAQDQVRLEVAFALEGIFPDAFVAYVEQRQMVPFFETGRIADGVLAATELIVTRAQHAAANAGFETEIWATASGGGGAVAEARIGQGPVERPARRSFSLSSSGKTPAAILSAYFEAMSRRNADPDLAIYTPETRRMLKDWTVTDAQMDSIVKTYRNCAADPALIEDGHAVIRYRIGDRACAPFFFERIDGQWALDLTMMQRAIRFGRTNAWRLDPSARHPYAFAFDDWRFDRNGFPIGAK